MGGREPSDREWAIVQPLPPQESRGVARVDDRRGINGILWRDVSERYGPRTTLYIRFARWRAAGVWDRILDAISEASDGDIVMSDSSCTRVDQHGAAGKRGVRTRAAWDIPAAARPPGSMLWSTPKGVPSA